MNNNRRIKAACEKELSRIVKMEDALCKRAMTKSPKWIERLNENIPAKVVTGLQGAFCKAFALVFDKGTSVIDKTYDSGELSRHYMLQDYAVRLKRSRKELKRMRKVASKSNVMNSLISTAEGAALGALGIGLPDVIVFIGILLKGAYEIATQYGYDHTLPAERMLILKMMEVALIKSDDWARLNAKIDVLSVSDSTPTEDEIKAQTKRTADAFAINMLGIKFIQGIPVAGIIGGIANPVYYNRVTKYVQLKYYKRYVRNLHAEL